MADRNLVDPRVWNELCAGIGRAFPETKPADREAAAEALIEEAWRNWDPCFADVGLPPPPPDGPPQAAPALDAVAPASATLTAAGPTYFVGDATHARETAKPGDIFVGHLPMVRVRCPQSGTEPFRTLAGDVLSGDHLVYSVDDVNGKFAKTLGYEAERVDLITPPRLLGARFGAIAVFLGYKKADGPPTFYLLEVGMATGEPKVLFFGKDMQTTIVQPSWYTPTPFSAPNHEYRGRLTMRDDVDPELLTVDAYRRDASGQLEPKPYIQVAVRYRRVPIPVDVSPALITAQAALRVAAVGKALGMQVFGPLTDVMASLGLLLPWIRKPA
jgi:hypothetical protein